MGKSVWIKTMIIVFAMITISGWSCFAGDKIMIVGESWPPFEFEQNGKPVGINVDIVSSIFQKMNVDFEIRIMPWSRAWKMIETGRSDASFSTSRKESRMPYLIYHAGRG